MLEYEVREYLFNCIK